MSIKIILVSTVLMSFGTNNFISGDVSHRLRGVLSPRLNITEASGNWYMVATTKPNYDSLCMSIKMSPQSEDSFIIKSRAYMMADKANSAEVDPLYNTTLYAKIPKSSNVIQVSTTPNGNILFYMAIFDIDITSYIAFCVVNTPDALNHGHEGMILVISRVGVLDNYILENIKLSNFYNVVHIDNKLLSVDRSHC